VRTPLCRKPQWRLPTHRRHRTGSQRGSAFAHIGSSCRWPLDGSVEDFSPNALTNDEAAPTVVVGKSQALAVLGPKLRFIAAAALAPRLSARAVLPVAATVTVLALRFSEAPLAPRRFCG
jgi:hypothetical protein